MAWTSQRWVPKRIGMDSVERLQQPMSDNVSSNRDDGLQVEHRHIYEIE